MTENQVPRPTPLHEEHLRQNARMIEYAGWHLPVQYTGITAEHLAVRQAAGVFDVSHMGEILIGGTSAVDFLNYLLPRDSRRMTYGRAYYSPMCYHSGGTVDDLIVYPLTKSQLTESQLTGNQFLLVVNAANTAKDFEHIRQEAVKWSGQKGNAANDTLTVQNLSDNFAQISLQGPAAAGLILKLQPLPFIPAWADILALSSYRFIWHPDPRSSNPNKVEGGCLVSRTGYTGEDGFEFYLPSAQAPLLWQLLIEHGAVPVGLGARDSLRLEAGMPLYGHELGPDISPLEAGLKRFVNLDKPAPGFIGQKSLSDSLLKGRDQSGEAVPPRRLVGVSALTRAIPRADYPVLLCSREIGRITSGLYSPSLNRGIAMALVDSSIDLQEGTVSVLIRERAEPFAVCPLPFYQHPG